MFPKLLVLPIAHLLLNLKQTNCVPIFAAEPLDDNIMKGNDHWFPCIVNELEESQILQWYKDGRTVQEGTRIAIERKQNGARSMLFINRVSLEDAGQYFCAVVQALNGETIIRSRTATLIVHSLPSPLYPYCFLQTATVLAGSTVKFSCFSEKVEPPVILSWVHSINSQDIVTTLTEYGRNISLEFSMKARKRYNRATFICKQVSPLIKDNQTCSIGPLDILYKPEAVIQHANPTLPGRETIAFCQTSSNPPVTKYQWLFDPHIPADEYSIDETGQILKLLNPKVKQTGTNITCIASNKIGYGSSYVILKVSNFKDDSKNEHTTGESTGNKIFESNDKNIGLSLDVVIIIAAGTVIIVVLVVLVPVYHYCLCRNVNTTTTTVDSSGKVVTQPEVYYEARDGVILRHTIQDRSLPRVPTTDVYGRWRHSTASQVPNDLESHSYTYIDTEND